MPKKTGHDPAQFGLFATPLSALIAPDAEVRVIAAFVDQLDLDELGFQRIKQDAMKALKARRANYESLQEQLAASADTQISLTDPDARSLIKHGRESLVGYNIQSVVDAANNLIVHTEATNENDLNALGDLVHDTTTYIGLAPGAEILADKGYHNAAELQKVHDLGLTTFVAERRHAANDKEANYPPSHFCFDPGQDAYICPAGELLQSTGKLYRRQGTPHRFQTYRVSRTSCKHCSLREHCLSATSLKKNAARSVSRLEHAAAVETNHENLTDHPAVYRHRQAIVEAYERGPFPFRRVGTLKRHWTGYYTLLKGLEKVDGEFSLLACCYNLRRSMSIFGVLALLERLKGDFSLILAFFRQSVVVAAGVFGVYYERPGRLVGRG